MNLHNSEHGGCLIVGLAGTSLSQSELSLLSSPLVAGVLLFTRNFSSAAQLADLCKSIRAARTEPLLIWVDQEGGRVQRFRGDGFTDLPACAALGELYDDDPQLALDMAMSVGWLMACELRSCGIDSSLAPVVDIGGNNETVIGNRAFHDSPMVIAELAAAYMRGMESAGMLGMAKHFPGHGMVSGDTHLTDCVDNRSLDEITASDLLPYKMLMRQGLLHAVMVAHVSYPQVDSLPAGYSSVWLRDVLRRQLGFTGLVVSDDLGMQAAAVIADVADRVVASINAGCDLLIVSESEQMARVAIEAVEAGSGLLPDYAGVPQSVIGKMYAADAMDYQQMQQQRDEVLGRLRQCGLL